MSKNRSFDRLHSTQFIPYITVVLRLRINEKQATKMKSKKKSTNKGPDSFAVYRYHQGIYLWQGVNWFNLNALATGGIVRLLLYLSAIRLDSHRYMIYSKIAFAIELVCCTRGPIFVCLMYLYVYVAHKWFSSHHSHSVDLLLFSFRYVHFHFDFSRSN